MNGTIFEKIQKLRDDKRRYRRMMARVKALPSDHRFVYDKATHYMWNFAAGDGYDMVEVQYGLIELFEQGAADGKSPLEITGTDVAAFCDELLSNAKTYTADYKTKLNTEVRRHFEK